MRDSRKDPRLVAFGERVTTLRKARGLTQEALAASAALSGKYVSEIERGAVNPSLLVLDALAAALGTEVGDLAGNARVPAGGADEVSADEVSAELRGRSANERTRALLVIRALFAPLR